MQTTPLTPTPKQFEPELSFVIDLLVKPLKGSGVNLIVLR